MTSLGFDLDAKIQTRQEIAVDRLREAILRGLLKPGQRLDQNEIADLLHISRSPVREAFRTLAAEGLIELTPHRGAVVAELSTDELEEIYTLRSALEGMAAQAAVPRMDEARMDHLSAVLQELDQTTDPDRWLELNHKFHNTIYEAANRPRMLALINNLRNTAAPYIRAFITSPQHMREAVIGHHSILKACQSRDPAAADRETRKHLMDVCASAMLYQRAQRGAAEPRRSGDSSDVVEASAPRRSVRGRPSI